MYKIPLLILVAAFFLVGIAVWLERYTRLAAAEPAAKLAGRETTVPNYNHVWFAHDIVFANAQGGKLDTFGYDYISTNGDWTKLCRMDSDKDGLTNGAELGDPCCLWRPTSRVPFSLGDHREYRRWGLTHPAAPKDNFTAGRDPPGCDSGYDSELYREQFSRYYFNKAYNPYEPTDLVLVKVLGGSFLVALIAYWVMFQGLCADIAPWFYAQPRLKSSTSLLVCLASYIFMDLTSGICHLICDYAPHWLPGLGGLARGFQYHHQDPTAIIRISWYAYVSHIHILCPVVGMVAILSDASCVQRLFWFWGAVNVHVFQTAHRWAHFPKEDLSWIVRTLQEFGLILDHERHMTHHMDLEQQFTILSGHTDVILDTISLVVPARRYDLWVFFGIIWFLFPVFLDIRFRAAPGSLESAKREKNEDAETELQIMPEKHV